MLAHYKKLSNYIQNILLNLCFLWVHCDAKNYCSFNICNGSKEHTLCKFQANGPAKHCIDHLRTIRSGRDKQDILDKINDRRNKIAAGKIRSLSPAENMLKLEWNDELELSAQRWVDQCLPQKQMDLKDVCRDLDDVFVGQNIATVYGESPGLAPAILVDVWYMELLNTNASLISRYRPSNQTGNHHYDYFTQLIWAESSQVGCGGAKFKEKIGSGGHNRTVHRLVCNFALGGNQLGESVYNEGIPCSGCPLHWKCDSVYSSLCSSPRFEKDTTLMRDILILKDNQTTIPYYQVTLTGGENENQSIYSDQNSTTLKISSVVDTDDNTTFDDLAQLFGLLNTSPTPKTRKFTTCKDVAVDDFIELLKKRLVNDLEFKHSLLTPKISESTESSDSTFTDVSVVDFISHIYDKKKDLPTSIKSTENNYLNSTLLVDLVQAVIFRNNDKLQSTPITDTYTTNAPDVSAVKIKAEHGEVKLNADVTGHYFFPEEDNDKQTSDTTESYYDISGLPISDIVQEIENLKRDKGTKDFLEEILESDFITENVPKQSPKIVNLYDDGYGHTDSSVIFSTLLDQQNNSEIKGKKRKKRKIQELKSNMNLTDGRVDNIIKRLRKQSQTELSIHLVNYKDLLQKLAMDLKYLKLNKRFHCTSKVMRSPHPAFYKKFIALFLVLNQMY